jgi:hypothetical protein
VQRLVVSRMQREAHRAKREEAAAAKQPAEVAAA